MKVKPIPNSSKKFSISSKINFCNTFSENISYLLLFFIKIGFLIKSTISDSFCYTDLFLADSGSLSYSLDFILSLNCLTDKLLFLTNSM